MTVKCQNLSEVRQNIDRLDREIIRLLAERSGYVKQATTFKSSPEQADIPERVEEVIRNVRVLSEEYGFEPDIAEKTYRVLVRSFIDLEYEILKARLG